LRHERIEALVFGTQNPKDAIQGIKALRHERIEALVSGTQNPKDAIPSYFGAIIL